MKHIEITEIKVLANPDTIVGECIQEAIELAAKEWKNVLLIHHEKTYLIKPNNLVSSIIISDLVRKQEAIHENDR